LDTLGLGRLKEIIEAEGNLVLLRGTLEVLEGWGLGCGFFGQLVEGHI
jgi:hypothetical protein